MNHCPRLLALLSALFSTCARADVSTDLVGFWKYESLTSSAYSFQTTRQEVVYDYLSYEFIFGVWITQGRENHLTDEYRWAAVQQIQPDSITPWIKIEENGTITGAGVERWQGDCLNLGTPGNYPPWYFPDEFYEDTILRLDFEYTLNGTVTSYDPVTGAVAISATLTVPSAVIIESGTYHGVIETNATTKTISLPLSGTLTATTHELQLTYDLTPLIYQLFGSHPDENDDSNWLSSGPARLGWPGVDQHWRGSLGQSGFRDLDWGSPEFVHLGGTVAKYKNDSPGLLELSPEYPKYWLQDVPFTDYFYALIDWREMPEPHNVTFTYGSTVTTVTSGSDLALFSLNYGDLPTSVTASVLDNHGLTQSLTYPMTKVPVPNWAGSAADWSATSGITYSTTQHWPIPQEVTTVLSDASSLLDGLWGLSLNADSELTINAASSGASAAGTLDADMKFKVAGHEYEMEFTGDNTARLSSEGLSLSGTVATSAARLRWKKTINPLTLIPNAHSVLCAISPYVCDVVDGIGLQIAGGLAFTGEAAYRGQPANTALEFTSGSVTATIDASATLSVTPEILDGILYVRAYGGLAGCSTVDFYPELAVSKIGAEARLGVEVDFFGASANIDKSWTSGDGCPDAILPDFSSSAPVAAPILSRNSAAASEAPLNGCAPSECQLTMTVRGDGHAAAAWSRLPETETRPHGNIELAIHDGSVWGAPIVLTNDAAPDLKPALAFDGSGHLIVAWMRSDSGFFPGSSSEAGTFASSLEIWTAVLDATTGAVVHPPAAMTTNTLTDFAPALAAGSDGTVALVWQRCTDADFSGSAVTPASLMVRIWDGVGFSTESVAATNLVGVIDWRLAARQSGRAAIVCVNDTDFDLSTRSDREISLIQSVDGVWAPPLALTANLAEDSDALLTFDVHGTLQIAWRTGSAVMGLSGDFAGPPQIWIPFSEELGSGFGRGRLVAHPDGLVLIWPDGAELLSATNFGSNLVGKWGVPSVLSEEDDIDFPCACLARSDGRLLLAHYSTVIIPATRRQDATSTLHLTTTSTLPMSYASWAAGHQLTTAAGDDPDQDGLVNLMEYLLNSDPASCDPSVAPSLSGDIFQFTINPRATGITWRVEISTDLIHWSALAATVTGQTFAAMSLQAILPTVEACFARLSAELD